VVGRFLLALVVAAASPARADEDLRRDVDAYLAAAPVPDRAGELGRLCAVADEEAKAPWTFTAALYLWAAGIEGNVSAGGTTVSIDVPFSELFDDLTGALMGRFGARKGRWGILVDVFWCALEENTSGPVGIRTEVDLFIGELTGSYTLVTARSPDAEASADEPPKGLFTLDAYAGARVYSVGVEITTTLTSSEQDETWVDPIVGFEARYQARRWLFLARGDVGGFGISSEFAWSVTVGVAYRCSSVFWLGAGYRWLDIDFESGGSAFADFQLSGPYLAFAFAW
jgi:opacity protein-like surface antigen